MDSNGTFDLEPGQTEAHDALRLHLLSEHGDLGALGATDDDARDRHAAEHHGPASIRNHDRVSIDWDPEKIAWRIREVEQDDGFLTPDQLDTLRRLRTAHIERLREPGRARTKLWTVAPRIYEESTRYTISVLPPDDPWRRHYLLHVQQRPDGKWIVLHESYWANAAGEWSVPSSGDHVPQHLFELDDALTLARKLAPTVEGGGGRTALDVLNLPKEGRR
jgi:hypothetical protein